MDFEKMKQDGILYITIQKDEGQAKTIVIDD